MVKLTGEELYHLYIKANLEINFCETDEWEDLSSEDQEMWNYLAYLVNDRG